MNSPSTTSHPDDIDGVMKGKEQEATANALATAYIGDPEKRSMYDSEPGSEDSIEIIRKAEDVAVLVYRGCFRY
jgi:hypothetical protein